MTPNPINALKITIYNKQHTKNTKIHFPQNNIFENLEHFQKVHFLILLYIKIP